MIFTFIVIVFKIAPTSASKERLSEPNQPSKSVCFFGGQNFSTDRSARDVFLLADGQPATSAGSFETAATEMERKVEGNSR